MKNLRNISLFFNMHTLSGDAASFLILVIRVFFSVEFGHIFDNFIDLKINLFY